MTREEQIINAASECYRPDFTSKSYVVNAFSEGVKWADEHPKEIVKDKYLTSYIGKDKVYVPPFHVETNFNDCLYPIIQDSTGTMVCGMFLNSVIANHVCELLNKEWK